MDELEQALQSLRLHSEDSAQTTQAVSVLANASKHDLEARKQLADQTVLTTLVEVVESSINDSLETADLALRCIGNASIDNNDAREILTGIGFSWLRRCMEPITSQDHQTPLLAAKVLYNICCDYEPAQYMAFDEHVHYELIHLLSLESIVKSDERSLLIELLFWICNQKEPDASASDPLPEKVLVELGSLPHFKNECLDTDDSSIILETCLLFLRDSQTQRDVILRKKVSRVLRMLTQNESRIAQLADNEEDRKVLIPLSNSLIWCLSDMAAMPEFSQTYDLSMEFMRWKVIDVIGDASSNNARILTATCQTLGNLLWAMTDPASFAFLVASRRLHEPVFEKMVSLEDAELLHAAAGVLIQLSRPTNVREAIGSSAQARAALELLCRHETPQLKQDGIKLLRALGKDCASNQERFADLAREVMQTSSEADTDMIEEPA